MDMAWVEIEYFGNSLRAWAIAGGVMVTLIVALELTRGLLVRRFGKLAARTSNPIDDLLVDLARSIKLFGVAAVGLYIGTRFLTLPAQVGSIVSVVLTIALVLQAALWGNVIISFALLRQFGSVDSPGGTQRSGYGALRVLLRLILWSLLLLLALDNFGVNVTALVAGLGVGGIAIALAVQNILGDVFCSLSIILDKPFELGDFIIVGADMGTVEHIGVKTTRLRSLGGEQLVFSNSDLVGSRVRNYKRMWQRRIVFEFGVTYQTSAEVVEVIPGIVREIVGAQGDARLDRAHFKAFGDSALIFEVVYYVLKPDYGVYMDVQQSINLALMRQFEAYGIEFAYPTQTVFVHQEAVASVAQTA